MRRAAAHHAQPRALHGQLRLLHRAARRRQIGQRGQRGLGFSLAQARRGGLFGVARAGLLRGLQLAPGN